MPITTLHPRGIYSLGLQEAFFFFKNKTGFVTDFAVDLFHSTESTDFRNQ